MEFNEKIALEIIKKFNISLDTLKVWKHRNKIPDKYFINEPEIKEDLSRSEIVQFERIKEIFNSNCINLSFICELIDLKYDRINDCLRGKSTINKNEFIRLKKEVNQLKIDIAKTFEKRNYQLLFNLLNNKILIIKTILKSIDKPQLSKVYLFANNNKNYYITELYEKIKNDFVIFALTLRV